MSPKGVSPYIYAILSEANTAQNAGHFVGISFSGMDEPWWAKNEFLVAPGRWAMERTLCSQGSPRSVAVLHGVKDDSAGRVVRSAVWRVMGLTIDQGKGAVQEAKRTAPKGFTSDVCLVS